MLIGIINAILAFSLAIPIVFRYRIASIEGTPYGFFGLLFLLLALNVFIAIQPEIFKKINLGRLKNILLALILLLSVGAATWTAILDRAKTAPNHEVHDIILQQEAAMRYLLSGKNPYKETYFDTPVASFQYAELGKPAVNPALYHFVMPPWYLLFPFLFYIFSVPIFGFFDGRMALVFCLVGLLVVLYKFFRDKDVARLAIILTALNPATVGYFIEGRSDIFALFWFVLAVYLLEKKRSLLSGAILALAIASKQTIWFGLPFYFLYALWQAKGQVKKLLSLLVSFVGVSGALMVPFLLWDPGAFLNSVIFYLSGNTQTSYPVSGYGLGMLLYDRGIIMDIHAYYPFILWQLGIGLPVLIGLLVWMKKRLVVSRLFLGYGMFLLVFWYLSRYFNNSHVGYIVSILGIGALKVVDEEVLKAP